MRRVQLIILVSLTVLLHFSLPYAAIVEEDVSNAHYGDYQKDHHQEHHSEGHLDLHELPHHIEPAENELEELDENNSEVELMHYRNANTVNTSPFKVFFYKYHYWNYHGGAPIVKIGKGALCA